jgi:hypothetical protein
MTTHRCPKNKQTKIIEIETDSKSQRTSVPFLSDLHASSAAYIAAPLEPPKQRAR